MTPVFEQLGLIGCGLMGGSFALALKEAGLVQRVLGYSKSPSTAQRALELGILDAVAPSAPLAAADSDLIVLAIPVASTAATLGAIRRLLTPQTLVMDVGSTKTDVVAAARCALKETLGTFVPCHPIAGSEASGIAHARANLYHGAQVVLTPTERTGAAQLERAKALWQALGCHVRLMAPQAHDVAFAAVSHLPHLLAFAFMNALSGQPDGANHLALAGPGFADFSRIAAANPTMWRDIFAANREQVLAQAAQFREALQQLEALIASGDEAALQAQLTRASQARAQWQPAPAREPLSALT